MSKKVLIIDTQFIRKIVAGEQFGKNLDQKIKGKMLGVTLIPETDINKHNKDVLCIPHLEPENIPEVINIHIVRIRPGHTLWEISHNMTTINKADYKLISPTTAELTIHSHHYYIESLRKKNLISKLQKKLIQTTPTL